MRVLMTGASEGLGSALAAYLAGVIGAENVFLTDDGLSSAKALALCQTAPACLEQEEAAAVINEIRPDRLILMPNRSGEDYRRIFERNAYRSIYFMEALRNADFSCRTAFVTSADIYQPSSGLLSEEDPMLAPTPFAACLIAMDELAYLYFKAYKLETIRIRPFECINAMPTAEEIKLRSEELIGKSAPLLFDYISIEEASRALWTILERGTPGTAYNLCSGHGIASGAGAEIGWVGNPSKILELGIAFDKFNN
ncbi:MAG: NAD-dependent epimerase/dehydratase family protein [bacterium]|nr:NAD-dependent epimerase/dehydratase family protein [bacterium]